MGAGILPICVRAGSISVLLGQERFDSKWSDFGGSSNVNEARLNTAVREGYEELDGFLGTQCELKNRIINKSMDR